MQVFIQLARAAIQALGVGTALELATPGFDIPFIPGGGEAVMGRSRGGGAGGGLSRPMTCAWPSR